MFQLLSIFAMRAKLLHSLTRALVVQCVLWVAVAAVLPQMHQAFPGHRHVFCVEHHRIEDRAEIETQDGSAQALDLTRESSPAGLGANKTSGRSGVECLTSNFSAHLVFLACQRIAKPVSFSLAPTRLVRDLALRITDTLRVAPKTSPPLAC